MNVGSAGAVQCADLDVGFPAGHVMHDRHFEGQSEGYCVLYCSLSVI